MKTFKSAKSTLGLTVARTNEDLVRVITQLPDETGRCIDLAPSDAPALALAILEAAGVTPFTHDNPVIYNGSWLESIADDLKKLIAHQESIATKAKAQAELEAEALELANAFNKTDWDFFPCNRTIEANQWLAVARKAREMRAEK